jgi:hypothetical protein
MSECPRFPIRRRLPTWLNDPRDLLTFCVFLLRACHENLSHNITEIGVTFFSSPATAPPFFNVISFSTLFFFLRCNTTIFYANPQGRDSLAWYRICSLYIGTLILLSRQQVPPVTHCTTPRFYQWRFTIWKFTKSTSGGSLRVFRS